MSSKFLQALSRVIPTRPWFARRMKDPPPAPDTPMEPFKAYGIDTTSLDEVLRRSDRPVIAMFSAKWCGPCRAIKPTFGRLHESFQGIFVLIDVDAYHHREVATIQAMPTFRVYLKGKVVQEQVGASEDRLLRLVGNYCKASATAPRRILQSVLSRNSTCLPIPSSTDVCVIGAGPAGLTAAIYIAQGNKRVCILEGLTAGRRVVGGQLWTAKVVTNFPGFPNGVHGQALIQNMVNQVTNVAGKNACFVHDDALSITRDDNKDLFIVETITGAQIACRGVVVATGSVPRMLDVPGYTELWGKGVHTCAHCDGHLYKDKDVAVVGGGDSALEATIYLSNVSKSVVLVHRRSSLTRAKASLVSQLHTRSNVSIMYDSVVSVIHGTRGGVTSLDIRVQGKQKQALAVAAVFVCIGHDPNHDVLLHSKLTSPLPSTVRLAGDVQDTNYMQAVTAAAEGCKAAMDILKHI